MKTLVLYASTCGYAGDCAQNLKTLLNNETTLVDIEKTNPPALSDFDTIIIGGSIYMGQIQKKVKAYLNSHQDDLAAKNLGLFISCATDPNDTETIGTFYQNAFPQPLLKKACSIENFGGQLRMDRMKFSHRLIAKMMMKSSTDDKPPVSPLPQNIEKMASAINALTS